MRLLTKFFATATISLTLCGMFPNLFKWGNAKVHPGPSLSVLNKCALSIFNDGKTVSAPNMEKSVQRVLWDLNCGQDLVLGEIENKSGIHIHLGPGNKRPTAQEDGLYYSQWKSFWMGYPCMNLVAVISGGAAVEVLLSAKVPLRQVWGAGVCRSGASTAVIKQLGDAALFTSISDDVAKAGRADVRNALTVALMDILIYRWRCVQ
jgi:hypothetical protein